MIDGTIATQPVEGVPADAGSQVQPIEGQPSETGQETGQPQVESVESQAPSQGRDGGRKPSGFYADRERYRKRIEALEAEVSRFKSQAQQPPVQPRSQTGPVPEDKDKQFWDSLLLHPREAMERLIKEVASQEVPGIAQRVYQEGSIDRQWQDAEKLITSNEAYRRDIDGFLDALRDIRERYKIHLWVNERPMEAAQLALEIYSRENKGPQQQAPVRPPNPNAPKKGQLAATATGSPAMTGAPNKDALVSELRGLQKQLVDHPELRLDSKFRERIEAIKAGLSPTKK